MFDVEPCGKYTIGVLLNTRPSVTGEGKLQTIFHRKRRAFYETKEGALLAVSRSSVRRCPMEQVLLAPKPERNSLPRRVAQMDEQGHQPNGIEE